MKKIILKVITSLFIGVLSLFGLYFLMINFIGVEQKNILFPLIDTKFSKNFHIKNWEKITNGMSKEKIVELLGEPFNTTNMKSSDCLSNPYQASYTMQYSEDGACRFGDFAWCCYSIYLDNNMNVIFKEERWWEN